MVAAALVSFVSLYYLGFGEVVIAMLVIICWLRKIPSRRIFMIAVSALIGMTLAQLIVGDESNIGDNLIVYALLLFAVGICVALREAYQDREARVT
jgi:hypothetical protein